MSGPDRPGPAPSASAPALLPAWSAPFHEADVGAPPALGIDGPITPAWAYGDGSGRGVRVAIVDSGIEAGHPLVGDVAEFVAVTVDASTERGVRFEHGPHDDLYGHGTACAGIVRELAPACELVSVRVLGPDLIGPSRAFAHGLDWCIEHGIEVVGLSLSTRNDDWAPVFWELVDLACHRNVLLVCAMNNEPQRSIPSEFAGVFSVACAPGVDREVVRCRGDGPAQWGAAGIGVRVAKPGGGTMIATGNSFAAPVVAGHLARIRGAHPGLTVFQAKTVLAALAR